MTVYLVQINTENSPIKELLDQLLREYDPKAKVRQLAYKTLEEYDHAREDD